MKYDTVIGLEVHAQLNTKSKLFSGAATGFGASPNSHTTYIDAGLPGTLPVLNREVLIMAIQFGLAIDATINRTSIFERKNYFYPDLPKGYQISQHHHPIVLNGSLEIELSQGNKKTIAIARAHLEEDAGKSIHDAKSELTGIDLNRAGTPLLEIVTEPCLYSAEEAIAYLKTIHQLVKFLKICDGNMQEGSFRCDVNISLKPTGSAVLGTRTELKNLNSFRFIEKAIAYEQARHQALLEEGKLIHQETRLYCPDRNITIPMRSKENVQDYRYFPDPDLAPVVINDALLQEARANLPLLPKTIKNTLLLSQALNSEDIEFLLSSSATYDFFSQVKDASIVDEKTIVNWLKGPYSAALNDNNASFETPPLAACDFAALLNALSEKKISNTLAKDIFKQVWDKKDSLESILAQDAYQALGDDSVLIPLIESLLQHFPEQVASYQAGKEQLMGFFIGHLMKETKGKADPGRVNVLLKEYLTKKRSGKN